VVPYRVGDFAATPIIVKIDDISRTLDREFIKGTIIRYFEVELKEK